jgi:Bacteriocin-protection, YdeI or OmpD-Associated/Domain of unknown function (DUF1905)
LKKTYQTQIVHNSETSYIPVTFDPKSVFGKIRAPVKVSVNGYTYRSTICLMHGIMGLPLRKSHRDAAGVRSGELHQITLELDTEERTVQLPPDVKTLLARAKLLQAWDDLSFTHRREHVEAINEARKPETRARRIEKLKTLLLARDSQRAQ